MKYLLPFLSHALQVLSEAKGYLGSPVDGLFNTYLHLLLTVHDTPLLDTTPSICYPQYKKVAE